MFNRPEDRFEDLQTSLKAVNTWLKCRKALLETSYDGEGEPPDNMLDAAKKAEDEIDSALLHISLQWPNLVKAARNPPAPVVSSDGV